MKQPRMTVTITLNLNNVQPVVDALDMMGGILTRLNYTWTTKERRTYERAIVALKRSFKDAKQSVR